MISRSSRCILGAITAIGILAKPVFVRADLNQEIQDALGSKSQIVSTLRGEQFMRSQRILFIAGRANEALWDYFVEAQNVAEEMGSSQVLMAWPPSKMLPEETARWLYESLKKRKLLDSTKPPLLIVAHSKGAMEALILAMNHPELMGSEISAVMSIHGAIRGSPLPERVERSCILNMPISLPLSLVCAAAGYFLNDPAISALRPENAEPLMNGLRDKLSAEERAVFDKRIFFVTGGRHDGKSALYLDALIRWQRSNFPHEETDGFLPVERQSLDGLGRVMGQVVQDHAQPVTGIWPASNSTKKYRRAFALGMFRELSAYEKDLVPQLTGAQGAIGLESKTK